MSTLSFNDSFLKWDAAQVSTFINMVTKDLDRQYGSLFLDNNIDGSLLPFLSTEHLKELGIDTLKMRLLIKKSISELIVDHYKKNPPQSIYDPEYALNNISIDSNQISLESLKVSAVLVQDLIRKFNRESRGQQQLELPLSPTQHEIKRLNDNFKKLKTDLIPVIRLLKDSKPLPTPTLDPGSTAALDSPTFSPLHLIDEKDKNDSRPGSGYISDPNRLSAGDTLSPTSQRFSSGSILSMGTGQIISQLVSKVVDDKSHEFKLQKVGSQRHKSGHHGSSLSKLRPTLVENTSSGSTVTVNTDQQRAQTQQQQQPVTGQLKSPLHQSQTARGQQQSSQIQPHTHPHTQQQQQQQQQPAPLTQPHASRSHSGNEPLKQLRASTDDSCLKILQHAMKRHHIPREDWSKYVLVICYSDKERILKLAEKPVVVYKELQELGKHPAIMLRQLADVPASEPEEYEGSRISSDIPGGVL